MSILNKILNTKAQEIAEAKNRISLSEIQQRAAQLTPRGFASHLAACSFPAIIAEIKRASPSKGPIRPDLNPVNAAKLFHNSGAACLSVLTDKQYFAGNLVFISQIRKILPEIPILRKDFIVDPYQIWEAKAAGADAVLLIVKALSSGDLLALFQEACSAGLDSLIEVHNPEELQPVLDIVSQCISNNLRLPLLGINNRDLSSFEVDLQTTKRVITALNSDSNQPILSTKAHNLLVVAESGIHSASDLKQLSEFGAQAFLVGESLVREGNPGTNLADLISQARL